MEKITLFHNISLSLITFNIIITLKYYQLFEHPLFEKKYENIIFDDTWVQCFEAKLSTTLYYTNFYSRYYFLNLALFLRLLFDKSRAVSILQ